MNAKNAERTLIVLIVVLVIIAAFLQASKASASVDTGRPDACRTYNVNFVFEGVENEDHKPCGPSDYNKPAKQDKQDKPATVAELPAVVVTDTPDVPVITEDKPADNDTPDQPDQPADTKGNPGNDKPVGNAGEKCDKSMCENADGKTGEHGKSSND